MGIEPQFIFGHVMHKRLFPRVNSFNYKMYNIVLPLGSLNNMPLERNNLAPISFYDSDHGACDGSNLENWARIILSKYNINIGNGDITLICLPRVLGYVFNPVSFWFCHDEGNILRAVLCEVHNTFGERHTYLCAHENGDEIKEKDVLKGKKIFHVSPFLKREGFYKFRFHFNDRFGAWIDYYDADGQKQLVTSFTGHFAPINKDNIRKAFWAYPLVTFKAITLIHWQALKLVWKRIKYIHLPKQKAEKVSAMDNITKL